MQSPPAVTRFNAPQEKVWEVMTDLRSGAERINAIIRLEVLTDGPIGLGTRFRETRVMFKKEATEEMEITEWDPPSMYAVEAESCGCHYKSVITCEPDGDGTVVTMTMHAMPLTFMAKLFSPLGKLMMGSCRKLFEKDLEDLRSAVESSAASPQPA